MQGSVKIFGFSATSFGGKEQRLTGHDVCRGGGGAYGDRLGWGLDDDDWILDGLFEGHGRLGAAAGTGSELSAANDCLWSVSWR